jgi:hypothetical protein
MSSRDYAELAAVTLAFATGLLAFSNDFVLAVIGFGLLMVGCVALCVAAVMSADRSPLR